MIQLYDYCNEASLDLDYSLRQAGIEGPAVFVNDDGFLPAHTSSPYAYFCGWKEQTGRPLYFNQLPVPRFWQITGNNSQGEVWNLDEKKATIFYQEPKYKRHIKNVDWYDKKGKVSFTEHYNQYGFLFARTFFTENQTVSTKVYVNAAGQEVIVENFLTGDILLSWQGKEHLFANRIDLLHFYFEKAGLDTTEIWYNSLSTPFLLSFRYNQPGKDILFWQEDIGEELPGNMRALLASPTTRTQQVIVQKRDVYEKIKALIPPEQQQKLAYLGYIFPELNSNSHGKEMLIVTNSDQIEQLDHLVASLPDYHFHIAALTEMSAHLQSFDRYPQVSLYPNISQKQLNDLYDSCDLYLDINHGSQVDGVLRLAFEKNLLILAFENTLHQARFVAPQHIFSDQHPEKLLAYLREQKGDWTEAVAAQRWSVNESIHRYRHVLLGEEGEHHASKK